MFGEDERADADEHEDAREDDAVAVVLQHPLAIGVFVEQPFRDEDGIVVALAEDEGGQDDVDNIKFDAAQVHDAQDPGPAHRQRQEGQQRQLQTPKREAEEEEHHDAAHIKDVVEIGRKGTDQIVAHIADTKGKTVKNQGP